MNRDATHADALAQLDAYIARPTPKLAGTDRGQLVRALAVRIQQMQDTLAVLYARAITDADGLSESRSEAELARHRKRIELHVGLARVLMRPPGDDPVAELQALLDAGVDRAGAKTTGWLTYGLKKRRKEYIDLAPVSVLVGTWNVAGRLPSSSLNAWLFGKPGPDDAPPSVSAPDAAPPSFPPRLPSFSHVFDAAGTTPLLDAAATPPESPAATAPITIPLPATPGPAAAAAKPVPDLSTPPPLPPRPPAPPADIIVLGFQEADTSTETYIAHDPATVTGFRERIARALGPHLERQYGIAVTKQLVGLVIVVLVHDRIAAHVTDIETATVGCGIMGLLGNKGAVAVRLKVHDTRLCFVNCHLAADADQWARRNSDVNEIRRRLWFRRSDGRPTPDPAYDEDETAVVWLGDMNYRLTGTQERVAQHVQNGNLPLLLQTDQLKQTMLKGDAFVGFEEANIEFVPTYKYDVGTSRFDTSEKKRTPAWCDRVLWRHPGPGATRSSRYTSHMKYLDSDHKPVSALLSVDVGVIDPDRLAVVTRDVLREHDRWENTLIPEASVTPQVVDFGTVRFMSEASQTVELVNTGKIPFAWHFVPRDGSGPLAGIGVAWCTAEPQRGVLEPGDRKSITFSVYVPPPLAVLFNAAETPSMSEIFILRLHQGRDFFIAAEGSWQRTCLARSLVDLAASTGPSRTTPPSAGPLASAVPPELDALTQFLRDHATHPASPVDVADLVAPTAPVSESAVQSVLDALDTHRAVPADADPRAVFRALATVLEYLPAALIRSGAAQDRVLAAAAGAGAVEDDPAAAALEAAVSELDATHRASLLVLLAACVALADADVARVGDAMPAHVTRAAAEARIADLLGPLVMRWSAVGDAGGGGIGTPPTVLGGMGSVPTSAASSPVAASKKVRSKIAARQRAFVLLVRGFRATSP
ncbi:hypothetical protein H9P43_000144 [Blastocladiella emersonii ATCC 22665]|nr:hypothetical protein H9P43_000144 [Blastocladiella emersonii ATCC 22665]